MERPFASVTVTEKAARALRGGHPWVPMRYLWVFAAYIALRNAYDTIPAEYRFVKNQAVAKFFGGWCFAVTAVCCVLGMYDKDPFTFALNVITPVVLTVLGFILPALAKREQTAAKK